MDRHLCQGQHYIAFLLCQSHTPKIKMQRFSTSCVPSVPSPRKLKHSKRLLQWLDLERVFPQLQERSRGGYISVSPGSGFQASHHRRQSTAASSSSSSFSSASSPTPSSSRVKSSSSSSSPAPSSASQRLKPSKCAPAVNADSFGRLHTYLRVSLTDRCNFR